MGPSRHLGGELVHVEGHAGDAGDDHVESPRGGVGRDAGPPVTFARDQRALDRAVERGEPVAVDDDGLAPSPRQIAYLRSIVAPRRAADPGEGAPRPTIGEN